MRYRIPDEVPRHRLARFATRAGAPYWASLVGGFLPALVWSATNAWLLGCRDRRWQTAFAIIGYVCVAGIGAARIWLLQSGTLEAVFGHEGRLVNAMMDSAYFLGWLVVLRILVGRQVDLAAYRGSLGRQLPWGFVLIAAMIAVDRFVVPGGVQSLQRHRLGVGAFAAMTSTLFEVALKGAEEAMRRGSHHAALRHFEDALTENPESAEAHALLSVCLSRMNRRFGAVEEAERALRIDPELPLGHIALGYAALATGDVKGAKAAVEHVHRLEPEGISALTLRCDIALATREQGELKAAALALRTRVPEDVYAICMLSRAASLAGKGAEAETLAREALRIEPDDAMAHEMIGWAFFAQRKYAQAKEAALSALSMAPDNESAFMLMAAAALRQRWLTGWMFSFALWVMQNSERTFMTAVIIFNAVLMLTGNVLWHYEQTQWFDVLNYGSWALAILALGSFVILSRILANEARNVRLVQDY